MKDKFFTPQVSKFKSNSLHKDAVFMKIKSINIEYSWRR